ncbi:MAG TPA: hypothetical protein VMW47_08225 [Verrucomicrobiae bacterium]|nr:hypothetical protein [Verrucomicrobiae bacterium]
MPAETAVPVVIEVGAHRVFASSVDWPGWTRSDRDEERALSALSAAAARYLPVAEGAGEAFSGMRSHALQVVERLPGSATTDFGAPSAIATSEHEHPSPATAARLVRLLDGTWSFFDRVVASAPQTLRKGPRGGGRDRDAIVDHVLKAETAYAGKLGLRLVAPRLADSAAVGAHRQAITATLLGPAPPDGGGTRSWPVRYAIRRLAWHVLDHAWEIEDKAGRATE